jgi:hypothetical protein
MFTAMDIVTPITPDGMCGWTKFGALMVWERDGECLSGRQIHDVRGMICRICQQGWVVTVASLKDQMQNHFDEWLHKSCYVRILAMEDRELFYNALIEARIRFQEIKEIPSRYWGRDPIWSKRNWCVTKALDQPIQITLGSRKRVYNLEFTPVEGELSKAWEAAGMEFHKEDVTKEFIPKRVMLHAWGAAQLKDFLKRLSNVFGLDVREQKSVPS